MYFVTSFLQEAHIVHLKLRHKTAHGCDQQRLFALSLLFSQFTLRSELELAAQILCLLHRRKLPLRNALGLLLHEEDFRRHENEL